MAQAENGHRARLEARMSELAIEIPPADGVRPSLWLRLQARVAPVDRLLAAREVAENQEADDQYAHPTGNPSTDALFDQIRGRRARAFIHGQRDPLRPERRCRGRGGSRASAARTAPGRREGPSNGGRVDGGAIYGANDGLAAVFGIVAGVSGATGGSSLVLTAGLAAAVASALSMATGGPGRALGGRGGCRQRRA